jgi:hypothetical protein
MDLVEFLDNEENFYDFNGEEDELFGFCCTEANAKKTFGTVLTNPTNPEHVDYHKDDLDNQLKDYENMMTIYTQTVVNKFVDLLKLTQKKQIQPVVMTLDGSLSDESEYSDKPITTLLNYFFPGCEELSVQRLEQHNLWVSTHISGSPMFARNIWYIGTMRGPIKISMSAEDIQDVGKRYSDSVDCFM